MTEYVELHARLAFSFLEGASLPEALIERVAALEMPAMALLDRNGVYGAPRFHMEAAREGCGRISARRSPSPIWESGYGQHPACRISGLLNLCGYRCWQNRALATRTSAA